MYRKTISPRISETNAAKHIGHHVIPVWLEEGFADILRLIEQNPTKDPVVAMANMNIDFLNEIFFGTDVEVMTAVKKLGKSSMILHQEIFQHGSLCVRAAITFVHFDFVAKKSKPIPVGALGRLREHLLAGKEG